MQWFPFLLWALVQSLPSVTCISLPAELAAFAGSAEPASMIAAAMARFSFSRFLCFTRVLSTDRRFNGMRDRIPDAARQAGRLARMR